VKLSLKSKVQSLKSRTDGKGYRVSSVECRGAGKRALAEYRLAFSLIEIMVTIALLSFIVLGLLAMFNQTQKAFRSSMTQVDLLEAGRAVMDMMARDMEQMVASEMPDTNGPGCTNFFAELTPMMTQGVLQGLPGTTGTGGAGTQECRTNVFHDVFVLAKQNLDYIGIGYHVHPDGGSPIVGTLYRFMTNRPKASFGGQSASGLSLEFRQATNPPPGAPGAAPAKMSRIADGVVHFQVRAYDTNGMPFTYYNASPYYGWFRTNGYVSVSAPGSGYTNMHNSRVMIGNAAMPDRLNYYFFSNAVPAYLELEVGFLEPHILDRLRGLNGNLTAQTQYLSNHVANVHLFRRRIPIRNVDFLAYQ
jgi:type II secretory pathway pseudopilin PulG